MTNFLKKIFGGRRHKKISHRLTQRDKNAAEKIIGYHFKDSDFLVEALTHRSYIRNDSFEKRRSYERLEFLGDSVLGLVVAEELFKKYPGMTEGDLTKNKALLVNEKVLAHVCSKIGLDQFILLSPDEEKEGGRKRRSIRADNLEAIIGAVYRDGGLAASRTVIKKLISFDFNQTQRELSLRNYKGELLELLQGQGNALPRYVVSDESGPDHKKKFTVDVTIAGQKMGSGTGDSKKSAEQKAAKTALAILMEKK